MVGNGRGDVNSPLSFCKLLKRLDSGIFRSVDTLNWGTLDVPKIRQISNPLIFEQVHFQSSNLVYKIHTSGNLLVDQKRATNNPKIIAIDQK